MKRFTVTCMLALFISLFSTSFAYAADPTPAPGSSDSGSLIGKISGNGSKEVISKADKTAQGIVDLVRAIGILGAICLGVWIGMTMVANGWNPNALLQMKTRIVFFILGLYVAYQTESLVGAAFNMIGYKVSL